MDIVQRLQNPPMWVKAFSPELTRAANEIVRLRAVLERLARCATADEMEDEDAEDEIERPRDTLDFWIKLARETTGEKP